MTLVSRAYPSLAADEEVDGVRFVRLRGFNHTSSLPANLILDFIWGLRVAVALPEADAVICNTISLPAWLPWFRRSTGRVAVLVGRNPKGQIRFYGGVRRLYAPTAAVARRISRESKSASLRTLIVGYPIDWALLKGASRQGKSPLRIGFVGRLHPEKGVQMLLGAAELLSKCKNLPDWELVLRGPVSVQDGGGGEEWLRDVEALCSADLRTRLKVLPPEFDRAMLADFYGTIDVFCYPSLSEDGETFGVAVAEAMASGCAVVVSCLDCFTDLVEDGRSGLTFDHKSASPEARLAGCLELLILDPERRRILSARGQEHVRRFDFTEISSTILKDISEFAGAGR